MPATRIKVVAATALPQTNSREDQRRRERWGVWASSTARRCRHCGEEDPKCSSSFCSSAVRVSEVVSRLARRRAKQLPHIAAWVSKLSDFAGDASPSASLGHSPGSGQSALPELADGELVRAGPALTRASKSRRNSSSGGPSTLLCSGFELGSSDIVKSIYRKLPVLSFHCQPGFWTAATGRARPGASNSLRSHVVMRRSALSTPLAESPMEGSAAISSAVSPWR